MRAASPRASAAAKGSSRKSDTRCEVELRKALWRAGARYRKNAADLLGKPDIVFPRQKVAVFCDGDFWHGRGWIDRKAKLAASHNGAYWVAKIERNMERDRKQVQALREAGWAVFRLWETDILRDPEVAAAEVLQALDKVPRGGVKKT